MFLTYFANGNSNVGTAAGAVVSLRMCNPRNKASVAALLIELIAFPQPLIIIPLNGSDRSLLGNNIEYEYGCAADGTLGRVGTICEHIRPNNHPMWHRSVHNGGAFLTVRVPRDWLYTAAGAVEPAIAVWIGATDDLRDIMPIPLGVLCVMGQVFLAMAVQRGEARPVVAVTPQGIVQSADDIAIAWHEATGLWINTTDVGALSDAAISLGYTIEMKANLPVTYGTGRVWNSIHAAVKCFAVGLGVPCVVSVIDDTDGLLTNPITRALLAILTQAMLSWGWPPIKLYRCALTRPFMLPASLALLPYNVLEQVPVA